MGNAEPLQARLVGNAAPEGLDAGHGARPAQEVERHAVQQARAARAARQAHVQLVQVVAARRRARAPHDLPRLRQACVAPPHALTPERLP